MTFERGTAISVAIDESGSDLALRYTKLSRRINADYQPSALSSERASRDSDGVARRSPATPSEPRSRRSPRRERREKSRGRSRREHRAANVRHNVAKR